MKKFLLLFLSVIILGGIQAHARNSASKLATPTFTDNGTHRQHYKLSVGSTTPNAQNFIIDELKDRNILVQNIGPTDVIVTTSAMFNTATDGYAVITKSSGSITLNNTTFYMSTLTGDVSSQVLITREQE